MRARHVAIFTLLGSAHVYPTLGVCAELVKRGYRVTYASNNHYEEIIRRTGAEPIVYSGPKLENADKIIRYPSSGDPQFWPMFSSLTCPQLIAAAAGAVTELGSFYQEHVPDLVLYDRFSYCGRILARRLGSPAIQLWAHFAHNGSLIREDGICLNPKQMLGFTQLLDSFLSAHEIEGSDNFWHTEKLNIYFVPREFQFDIQSFDHRSCFVGTCLDRPSRGHWKNSSKGKPIVLVSESQMCTDRGYLTTCIHALRNSEYHVVLSIGGGGGSPFVPDRLPENFEINRDAYNLEIMPHAALTITQSGMGTALESVYYGVPVLAVPFTPYHAEVGYRIAELGLGAYVPAHTMTSERIRENVDKLVGDTALLDRVQRMQRLFRSSGGAEMAADRIEDFLARAIAKTGQHRTSLERPRLV